MNSFLNSRLLLLKILFIVIFSPSVFSQNTDKPWQQQVEELMTEELKNSKIPSLQIAIGINQDVVLSKAYGFADIEQNVLATPKTKYRIASISKWLTATTIMKMVEQKKIDLDAPIQQYCPQYPEKQWHISTRQLLTHTAGVRHYADYDNQLHQAKTLAERAKVKARQAKSLLGRYTRYTDMHKPLENFKADKLLFKPGSKWQYTSFGYRILGCIIETAAKQTYDIALQNLVFAPSNMTNTVRDDAWKIIPHRSSGYRLNSDKTLRRANMRDVSENLPAGGHLSTASDLVKFALAFNNKKLINAMHKKQMTTPLNKALEQLNRAPHWRDAIPSAQNYSHGVMLFPQITHVNIGHSGRQAGADAMVVLDPTTNIAISILTNVKGYNGALKLIEKIQAILAKTSIKE